MIKHLCLNDKNKFKVQRLGEGLVFGYVEINVELFVFRT